MKAIFSFHFDKDLKIKATRKAEEENRSLANLIETAVIRYLNPNSSGARVTVIVRRKESKLTHEFTSKVRKILEEKKSVLLWESDPVTGFNTFLIEDIKNIHLI